MSTGKDYEKRLKALRHELSTSKSQTRKHCYQAAIHLTEESLSLLDAMITAVEERRLDDKKEIDERFEQESRRLKAIESDLEQAKNELESAQNDFSREAALLKLKMARFLLTTDVHNVNTEILGHWSTIRLNVIPALTRSLFDDILAPDESSFKLEAVLQGIEFAISLIPILGHIFEGVRAIWGIATRRGTESNIADKQMRYIEEYCVALVNWNAAAAATVETLKVMGA